MTDKQENVHNKNKYYIWLFMLHYRQDLSKSTIQEFSPIIRFSTTITEQHALHYMQRNITTRLSHAPLTLVLPSYPVAPNTSTLFLFSSDVQECLYWVS